VSQSLSLRATPKFGSAQHDDGNHKAVMYADDVVPHADLFQLFPQRRI
jgi:hypothetical protein